MKKFHYLCGNENLWIPIAENYRDCITLFKSDYFRMTGRNPSIRNILFLRGFKRFHFWLRMSGHRGWAYIFCRFMYKKACSKYHIDLSPDTKIGYGLYLGHGTSLIVNPTAIIGNNCNLGQFTTIGSNRNSAAIIGNNIYIGPSVCIVENVCIESNSTIGAGSVVTRDIPGNTTAAGVPARKISDKHHPEYVHNRWTFE